MAKSRSVKRLLVKRRLLRMKRLVKKPANPRNTKNNNAAERGDREERMGCIAKLLNHYEKGNDSLILSSAEERRTFTSFPIVPSSFRFFRDVPASKRAHYNTLSLSLSQPLPQFSIKERREITRM